MKKTKSYFASDFHLGAPTYALSRERETRIVHWLDSLKSDAAEVFLMGDIFDFWFEYKTVIPKGYIRLLGKLAELSDGGTQIYFFKGNHDMWVFDYFKKEFSTIIIDDDIEITRNGKKFFLHHGDGVGKGDKGYKLLKKIFRNKFCQWLFSIVHPNIGVGLANYWSSKSKLAKRNEKKFEAVELAWISDFNKNQIALGNSYDFIIMGHRHFPVDVSLQQNTRYINLGEWINFNTYAVFDGNELKLMRWGG
ncbi:MAG: UDP-2,3-diacylglucosamine diphosphatase [Sphingobacteriales bacterium]|nr:MAG: UDP-2,3-diacylglucosamine diphosphatase [Sphingobacteriales bacterium]TAF80764.1 MAG: UDP-2,3-diacylglucosamine diphosphatase [Sphingobacteriales bacterium]